MGPLVALALLLGGGAHAAAASKEDLKIVDFFLKTPTADLPPEAVPDFLAIDPNSVPPKLKDRVVAKRAELFALKKNAEGKYKPPLRLLGKDAVGGGCEAPREMADVGYMTKLGFEEITEEEEQRLMTDTNCSECELRTEFSLELVLTPPKKKGGKKVLHYLLHGNDPVMVLIGGYRAGASMKSTSFFGIGGSPKCR